MLQFKSTEKGQVLVIVVLIMVAMIGMLALVLDGGVAYSSRRRAQNAADAGAMAGADTLCRTSNATTAQTTALEYAITRNQATTAVALANMGTRSIAVNTTVQADTFFAGIFGTATSTATASARAGCFPVCQSSAVLPISWACRSPAGTISESASCAMQFGTVDTPGPIYLIMDTQDLDSDFNCQVPPNSGTPPNTLDCDLNNDGVNDTFPAGNRSWLNLDGGSGNANELPSWIENGVSPTIRTETWYGGSTGNKNVAYSSAEARVGDIVAVPVFDKFCDGAIDAACAGGDLGDPVVSASANTVYFHVTALAAFKITCVFSGGNDAACPGRTAFINANTGNFTNVRSIEGYFVRGFVPGMTRCTGGNAYNTGVFTVHLLP